ncbi:MAG: MFS transporter [Candidatus Zixiibacteriota bacterium]
MVRRNAALFYFLEGLLALAGGIILPLYIVYFRLWDITLFEIAVLAVVFEGTIILFELPTGIFADKFGRKYSVVIGYVLFTLSGVIFFYFRSFIGFLIAEILFGIAETFVSGALEALVVDSINDKKKEAGLFANRSMARTSGMLIGMVSVGFWAGEYIEYLFVPVVLIGIVMVMAGLFLVEYKSDEANEGEVKPKRSTGEIIFGNRIVLALFAVGLMANFVYEGPDQYWQVLFEEIKKFDPAIFGYLTAGGLLIVTLTVRFTKKYYQNLTLYLWTIFVITGAALFGAVYISSIPAVIGIIVYFAAKEFIRPAISTHLNNNLESKSRATGLSAYNLTCSIGEVTAGLTAGVIASELGIAVVFYISVAIAVMVPVVYRVVKR